MLKNKPFVIFLFLSFFSLIIFLLSNFFANLDYSGGQEIESNLNTELNCEGENRHPFQLDTSINGEKYQIKWCKTISYIILLG